MDLPIELDAADAVPLHRQLSTALRDAIASGRIARGTRLPSTRALADSIGVSRSTVIASFAQLHSEGYLEAATGSGTFVARELPDAPLVPRARTTGGASLRLSTYGASLLDAAPLEPPRVAGTVDFRDGRPAFDAFPLAAWRTAIRDALDGGRDALDYSADPAGYVPLRAAIAADLGATRGIACTADDVVIVGGSQQAIDIVARVTLEPGDVVALEEPGYLGAQRTFAAVGADLRPIPIDGDGLDVDRLARDAPDARLVYVTPSHQFPLGVVLASERRHALVAWAKHAEALIVEDDYDSAYRYEGRAIPALAGLDHDGRVVYAGTFSKTMFPALRIGFVVVPPSLRRVVVAAKAFSDRQAPLLEQRALAGFMASGEFDRHLRRMRVLYRARRAALLDALREHFGAAAEVVGESAGMHVVVRLPLADPAGFARRAAAAGVTLAVTDSHRLGAPHPGEFIFGFAEHAEPTIRAAIARLGKIFAEQLGKSST
jgi:GntR family transcriptional regulator/MocR family aminotransferase